MAEPITLDQLRVMATRARLTLSEGELARLLPGVNRARNQAGELRKLISDRVEPASTFSARVKS